jgi:hypothetical protein
MTECAAAARREPQIAEPHDLDGRLHGILRY